MEREYVMDSLRNTWVESKLAWSQLRKEVDSGFGEGPSRGFIEVEMPQRCVPGSPVWLRISSGSNSVVPSRISKTGVSL